MRENTLWVWIIQNGKFHRSMKKLSAIWRIEYILEVRLLNIINTWAEDKRLDVYLFLQRLILSLKQKLVTCMDTCYFKRLWCREPRYFHTEYFKTPYRSKQFSSYSPLTILLYFVKYYSEPASPIHTLYFVHRKLLLYKWIKICMNAV